MTDPVVTTAGVVLRKTVVDGYSPDQVLAMIPPGDRAAVASLLARELACQTLEASGGCPAPDRVAECMRLGTQGRALRQLARLLLAVHHAMDAAGAETRAGARRLVGLRPPPLAVLVLAAGLTLAPVPGVAAPRQFDPLRVVAGCEPAARPIPEPGPPPWLVAGLGLMGLGLVWTWRSVETPCKRSPR